MENKIEYAIFAHGMDKAYGRVIVGFSGGADSSLLLHYFAGKAKEVVCVHVNHMIRGEEADRDQQFCQSVCEKYGVELLPSYGLSETLFISTRVKGDMGAEASVGSVLPMVNLQFSDAEEIFLDVPWMFLGYSNENTAEYFDGKYYKSGDLGEIVQGHLQITGRKKDLIIRGGMNITLSRSGAGVGEGGMATGER